MQEGPIIGTGNGTDRHIKGDRRKAAGVYMGIPPGSNFKTQLCSTHCGFD